MTFEEMIKQFKSVQIEVNKRWYSISESDIDISGRKTCYYNVVLIADREGWGDSFRENYNTVEECLVRIHSHAKRSGS